MFVGLEERPGSSGARHFRNEAWEVQRAPGWSMPSSLSSAVSNQNLAGGRVMRLMRVSPV